jgi:uncharacterized protein (DUF1330 family)
MISGGITNPEQAGKYFGKINDVVVKGCGAKTLSVDYKTDVREGYDGPFSVLSQFPSKQAAIDCYEGPYQELIPLRNGAIDMNFRIIEKKDSVCQPINWRKLEGLLNNKYQNTDSYV